MQEERFKKYWEAKTKNQVEKEILSLQKYMDKHSQAYSWHGKGMTPPGSLADGDKMLILREILKQKSS